VTGRVAIVTGAGRGIGLATASLLAERGHRVLAVDVDEERVRAEAPRIGAEPFVADVTDRAAVERLVGEVGRVDVLVNNAGIAGRSLPTWELEDEDWHSVVALNLTAAFWCCRAVLPGMRERGWGRIVNVASIAGKEGNPNAVPYSATKAGVIGLTKAIAKEVATDGVLVNCVTPAVIKTELLGQMSEAHVEYMLSKIPMRRPGEVEEVARLIAWLSSDECSFSTGAVFDISGGRATY
jgi:NAD(P)-dependent dehydrogenase (short-subunit alcohol dehydrogenase family)